MLALLLSLFFSRVVVGEVEDRRLGRGRSKEFCSGTKKRWKVKDGSESQIVVKSNY